ncbi:hypothetical protein YB2330_001461 [Saitoella coloradoensis]
MDEQRSQAFQKLKPICINLSQLALSPKPSSVAVVPALQSLRDSLRSIEEPEETLNHAIGDYVFFPLSHLLRNQATLSDSCLELLLQCMNLLIKYCWRTTTTPQLFRQLLILLTFLVGGAPAVPPGKSQMPKRNITEHCKLAAVQCLSSLFLSGALSNVDVVTDMDVRPALGHAITTLLDIVLTEQLLELQVEAVSALRLLYIDLIREGSIVAAFLPGTVSGVTKTLVRTAQARKSEYIAAAVGLLSSTMTIALTPPPTRQPTTEGEDEDFDLDAYDLDMNPKPPASSSVLGGVERTEAWYQATTAQLKIAIETILHLRHHTSPKVRSAFLSLSREVVVGCGERVAVLVPALVETAVVCAGEDVDDIRTAADAAIKELLGDERLRGMVMRTWKESLHHWITALPRIMTSADDVPKRNLLSVITTSVRVLTEQDMAVDLSVSMDALVQFLGDLSTFLDVKAKSSLGTNGLVAGMKMLDISPSNSSDDDGFAMLPMRDISDPSTIRAFVKLLHTLGSSPSAPRIIEHFLSQSQISRRGMDVAGSTWVATQLVSGALRSPTPSVDMTTIAALGGELYEQALSMLSESSSPYAVSVSEGVEPVALCTALEAVTFTAETAGVEFRGEFVDALYPIVQLVRHDTDSVRSHARTALQRIAYATGYDGVPSLLLDNVDYLVNAVSLKLNTFDIAPAAPLVLLVLIRMAGARIVPYLEDVVESIFVALDNFHRYQRLVEVLFGVLEGVVDEVSMGEEGRNGMSVKRIRAGAEEHVSGVCDGIKAVVQEIQEAKERREQPVEETEITEPKVWTTDEGEEDQEPSIPDESKPPPPTKSYEIVHSIIEKAQNYLTHPSSDLRYRLVALIQRASPVLAANEDKLLPLINTAWPPLKARLADKEAHVVTKALEAVADMSVYAGDFMSERVAKDAWPAMRRLLRTELPQPTTHKSQSLVRPSKSMERYSRSGRVAEALFGALAKIIRHTFMTSELFDEVLEICLPYLRGKEEGYLRETTEELRSALEAVNADAVWLELRD